VRDPAKLKCTVMGLNDGLGRFYWGFLPANFQNRRVTTPLDAQQPGLSIMTPSSRGGDIPGGWQVDPHLSRTVVVSTKLDTRLPQFARGSDVDMFLHPAGRLLEPGMLGGCPFYT